MTREEWTGHYAARIKNRTGWSADEAQECARIGAEVQHQNGEPWTEPEAAADEELSHWTDEEGCDR